ncbi:uncharacterized protein LOC135214400 isoform X2 [Macrobrachium nipponense]|uniref:uncharacterized protein LOC135214400 isoform X2 n=1 Tax=Macrobrachium nipponense TaxID=159736 RepID=UPI0030C7CE35
MIAFGLPSTPGGDHPRGPSPPPGSELPQPTPQQEEVTYDLKNDPAGHSRLLSLLASVGPLTSSSSHFCLLKVVLLILHCFCLAVRAAAASEEQAGPSALRVGEPMLRSMDTPTPILASIQRAPFVGSSKGKGSPITQFIGQLRPSNLGNQSDALFLELQKKGDLLVGITTPKYLAVHWQRNPAPVRFNSDDDDDDRSGNELYLRLARSSWKKVGKRKNCDLCNKQPQKRGEQQNISTVNNHNTNYSNDSLHGETDNERNISNQKLPHDIRWVNVPVMLETNPDVPSNEFYSPGNGRRSRRERSARGSSGIKSLNSQSKRRPWNGNLQQPLFHRSLSRSSRGDEMKSGTNFVLGTNGLIFRQNFAAAAARNGDINSPIKKAVGVHHLVGSSEFNHPEWTTLLPVEEAGGGSDEAKGEQRRIPQLESNQSDRGNASSIPLPPRLTTDPFSISDTWQRILFARIHGDEKWKRIAEPSTSFSAPRVPKYLFQVSSGKRDKEEETFPKEEVFRMAREEEVDDQEDTEEEEKGGLGGVASSEGDIENWRSSETSGKTTTVFVNSFQRRGVWEARREEVGGGGGETVEDGVHKPDKKGKKSLIFLWEDKSVHEGQKRSFKKRRQKRKIEMLDVTVVEGGLAALPCDLKVEDPKDSVQLILWIKEGIHTPLYSYDYRELLGGRPREIRPDANSTLSRRTTFRTDRTPAALIIERTDAEDAGIYRCRVDFLLSPTINRRVNLTVIVPPSELRVSWQLGNSGLMEVHNREAGPFLENSQPSLACFSDDGWPPPSLSWYEGDELLDSSYTYNAVKGQVENELSLAPLTRDDLGRRLTCQASNSNKTHPTALTVSIAMTLSIISVEVEPLGIVWAGEKTDVECHVWGSRPSPSVVWWLGHQMIPTTQSIVLDEGNETISVLNFVPTPRDDGNMLICQATNEKLPDQAVQDSILLSVNYAPVVEVHLGKSLNPDRIKEGDHVYFECSVKSKPPVLTVSWRHNGRPLVSGSSEQVLVSNMSLVVQGVTRAHAGNYTCHATNVRNTSSSAPLRLDVKYAPVCASSEKTQYSVAKLENAEIACKVHANPADVTFKWTFNNTAEAIDVPEGRFVVVKTESRVNYTPMNELDYGTLLCWANNTIGIQAHPCVFHIVAAGKPDPPHNCRVFDVTVSSLQIACLAGDDGGLTQNFSLKVYQVGKLDPIVNVSRLSPSFSISGLRPATAYKITIVAINDKGSSKVTELKAYTITVPETPEETNAEPARDQSQETRVPVAVAVGIAVALVPVLVMLVGVLVKSRFCGACKRRSRRVPETEGPEKACHSKEVVSTVSADDINPDIISHTADPPVWEGDQQEAANISTIIPASSDLLPNGGSTSYPAAVASTSSSSGGGAKPSPSSRVAEQKQQPATCMAHHHHHVHDTTCLNTSLHAHTCLSSAAAAMPTVPYYPGIHQHQAVEAGVPPPPPPESFNLGCVSSQPLQPALPTSFNPLVSTLDRKRNQPSTSQLTCPHPETLPLKYMQGSQNQHHIFPHIYHQRPSGACTSCGPGKPVVQAGLHCPLSRMQSFPNQSVALGARSHHGSQCSLSHTASSGYPGQIPLPVISRASDVEFVHPLSDSKKCCGSGRTSSVVLSPPLVRQVKPEEGRKHERAVKDSAAVAADPCSSPGQSTRESTV